MYYHQKQYTLYSPVVTRLSIGASTLVVNYIDSLDESCVEFRHVHNGCYEIYYCREGTQKLVIEDETHTLTEGNFAILRPNIYHNTIYEPKIHKHYVVFVFSAPTSRNIKDIPGEQSQKDTFLTDVLQYFDTHTHYIGQDTFGCSAILERMLDEIVHNLSGKDLMIGTLYQQYILSILRCMTKNDVVLAEKPQLSASNQNMAIMITKYMHENYHKNITIQDISDAFFISTRHVNRIFENYFGQSFKKTLNIYRLNYAKNYLLDTDYSIEKIAALVGLASPQTLYQLFVKVDGITVAEFCKANTNRKRNIPAAISE